MTPLARATCSCVCAVLESSDNLAVAFVAIVVAAIVSAVTSVITSVISPAVVTLVVSIVVVFAVAVAVPSVAAAVCGNPNLFLYPRVVSRDPNFAGSAVAVATSFVVARNPPFSAYPFPVTMAVVVSATPATVVSNVYVVVEVIVGDNGSNNYTSYEPPDDGLLLVAGAGGVWGDEGCDDC